MLLLAERRVETLIAVTAVLFSQLDNHPRQGILVSAHYESATLHRLRLYQLPIDLAGFLVTSQLDLGLAQSIDDLLRLELSFSIVSYSPISVKVSLIIWSRLGGRSMLS